MSVSYYTVLAASGGWVNGLEVPVGSLIALNAAEARYELDLGHVIGSDEPPPGPIVPALLPSDIVPTLRGLLPRSVPMAAIESYLLRETGSVDAYLDERAAVLGADLTAMVTARLAEVLGGVDTDHDTFAKVVSALAALAQTVSGVRGSLLGDADAAHDTLGKLAALIGTQASGFATKASKADLLATVEATLAALDARVTLAAFTEVVGAVPAADPTGVQDATAALSAWLQAPGLKRVPPGAVYRITAPLPAVAGTVIDWRGATLQIEANSTANTLYVPVGADSIWSRLKVRLPAGTDMRRPIALNAGATLRGVAMTAVDQQAQLEGDYTAAIVLLGDRATLEDYYVDGWDRSVYCTAGKRQAVRRGICDRYKRGFSWTYTEGLEVTTAVFGTLSPNARTDPGHNAIGRGVGSKTTRFRDIDIQASGEHAIYLSWDGEALIYDVDFKDVRIRRSGQCALKAKGVRGLYAALEATDIAYPGQSLTNKDVVRLENVEDFNIRAFGNHVDRTDEGYDGTFLNGVRRGYIEIVAGALKGHGVEIVDELGLGTSDVTVKLTVGSINLNAVQVATATAQVDNVTVVLDVGAVGGDVVNWDSPAPARASRIAGTYESVVGRRLVNVGGRALLTDQIVRKTANPMPELRGLLLPETRRWVQTVPDAPKPEATRLIDKLMDGLVTIGLGKFNFFTLFAAPSQGTALIDLKLLDNGKPTLSGTPVFTVGRGFAGSGASQITTPLNPSVDTSLFQVNSAHVGIFVLTDLAADGNWDLGVTSSSGSNNRINFNSRNAAGAASMRLNDSADLVYAGNGDGRGYYVLNRSAANARALFKNGAQVAADTQAASGVPTASIAVHRNGGAYGTRLIGLCHAGPALTADEIAKLNALVQPLMTL